jgi:hypothetical protein
MFPAIAPGLEPRGRGNAVRGERKRMLFGGDPTPFDTKVCLIVP